jgi:hypothetical protein
MRSTPLRPSFILAPILLAGALALPAGAVPYDALFDGPSQGGTQFGISVGSAAAAQAAGVPIVTTSIFAIDGVLEVVDQDVESINIDPSDLETPFEVDSTWTIENVFGQDLDGTVYLLFVAADPREIVINGQTEVVDHIDSEVGLQIDGAGGWSLVQTSDAQLGTLHYAAFSLGSMDAGQQKQVDLRYVLNDLINFPQGAQTVVPLPKLRIALGFTPIPEPGTALLVALGLTALAARARQRS